MLKAKTLMVNVKHYVATYYRSKATAFSPKKFHPKNGQNPLPHAFQWETEMLITSERYGRSSPNLVCNISAAAATRHYAQKPEIPKQNGR